MAVPADPAFTMATEGEYRALRIAVSFALRTGLATDNFEGEATNESLVSVARKLGVKIPGESEEASRGQ